MEIETRFGEEFMTKKKQNIEKMLEEQPLTREKLENENLKTNRERNEIEWQRLNLERRRLTIEETQRYMTPEHEYEDPVYERRGEKSKHTYQQRTM